MRRAPQYYSDAEITSGVSRGDEPSFNELYYRYSGALYAAIIRYLKDEVQADDLLQAVFIRLWEKRADLGQVKDIRNYLFIVARNMVFNHFKKIARDQSLFRQLALSQPVGTNQVMDQVAEREYKRLISEAVELLPTQQKEVYQLAEMEELSYQEIADRMSLSRLTVKKHLELARKFVRAFVSNRAHPMVTVPILLFFSKSL